MLVLHYTIIILLAHYLIIAVLCLFGAHRLYLTFIAFRAKKRISSYDVKDDNAFWSANAVPRVTVQAPVFNEKFVVSRLIDALARLEYPADRLQIQIVDDSTDESVDIAAAAIRVHQERGVNIAHVRREYRQGYKAGALQDALNGATGDYIAIFDADFLPDPDFLRRTIPTIAGDPAVGMVQTRWRHLNIGTNLLTRVQSIILDAHFAIEQVARYAVGAYFNFNGTGGVWRKAAIADAGGWRADTLTEDLDLSYRAQMKGWRFVYLRDVSCPSELPRDMRAFKTQQHRWAKGAIEVMKKLLADIWRRKAPLKVKLEATFHLTSNISYALMLFDAIFLMLPAIYLRMQGGWSVLTWIDIPLFFLASVSHAFFFMASQKILYGTYVDKLTLLPGLLATSIGLSVNNGRAVLEAAFGYVTGFVRTPKTGDMARALNSEKPPGLSVGGAYHALTARWAGALELMLGSLYAASFFWILSLGYWIAAPFLALFALGFFFVASPGDWRPLQIAPLKKSVPA